MKRKGKVRLVLVETPRLAFSFFKRGRHECYLIKIQGSALLDFLLTAGLEGNSRDPTGDDFFFSGSQLYWLYIGSRVLVFSSLSC